MEASFVIGYHTQRFDNLLQTLRFLERYHKDVVESCELVSICQDEINPGNLEKSKYDTFHKSHHWGIGGAAFEEFQRIIDSWKCSQHFDLKVECMQLPILTNFGVEKACADKVIILESDRILPRGYFSDVIKQLKPGIQITTKKMLKLTAPCQDNVLSEAVDKNCVREACEFPFKDEYRNEKVDIGQRNMWSGNTAIMKEDFYKAGKMDEFYKGYGWADNDMTLAMEKSGARSIYRDETELHLWHPPATYGAGDQKKLFLDNGLHFCKKWDRVQPDWFKDELRQHQHQHQQKLFFL